MGKVFGIGFHKTATTSLRGALRILGYNVTGPNGVEDPNIAQNLQNLTRKLADEFDAFQDNPWPLVFEDMDARYPDAKFILTTRNPEKWAASMTRHFATKVTPMREMIYGAGFGAPEGFEAHYIARMTAHNAQVRTHFEDRPGKLLEIDLTASGDTWAPLCAHLGHPVPDAAFPHQNKAETREQQGGLLGKLIGKWRAR